MCTYVYFKAKAMGHKLLVNGYIASYGDWWKKPG